MTFGPGRWHLFLVISARFQIIFSFHLHFISGHPQRFGGYPGGVIPPEAAMMFSGTPDSGMVYSPEQYMWMQQMYAQYMAQYMQQ